MMPDKHGSASERQKWTLEKNVRGYKEREARLC